ncbi:MAG: hypothetical protein GY729_21385 [Desulfobacteraceae bacterium]|nr:hypothetical protein [Desulfobacteraceae bacterium]
MQKETYYTELWSFFEYFLAYAEQGIDLKCFSLVHGENQHTGTHDSYVYEKITRSVLAQSSRGIKRFAKEYVQTDKLGQIEGTAKSLQDSLKQNLYKEIKYSLNKKLIDILEERAGQNDEYLMILMIAIYYAYFKNKRIPGYSSLHFYYIKMFINLLTISEKLGHEKQEERRDFLQKKFLQCLSYQKSEERNLKSFFEDEIVKKMISKSFASIFSFMEKEKERTLYMFEVVNNLSESHYDSFKKYIANGFYASVGKEKRFSPKPGVKGERSYSRKVQVIPEKYILGIINRLVDRSFDDSLEMMIHYCQSAKIGKPKKYLLKNYDKAHLKLNRQIWREIQDLVETQKQVFFRSKHLLRVIVHYLFEIKAVERDIWVKYIPSVEKIVHYVYRDTKKKLVKFNKSLDKAIVPYRKTKLFAGTDWEGFYDDSVSKEVAKQAIQDIVDRASSKKDTGIPAVWFSVEIERGIDYNALFRFFKQAQKYF